MRIVTDSTAQLPLDWARENAITVLPQRIALAGRVFLEGVDLSDDEFAAQVTPLPVDTWPVIEPPTVDDYIATYQQLLIETSDIICVLPSDRLSQSGRNARQAAEVFRGRCHIAVLDSQTVALGLNVLVRKVNDFVLGGHSSDDVIRLARGVVPHIYGAFITQDLAHVSRSGCLRPAQAALGDLLGIIPFLSIEEGEIAAIEKVRSIDRAIEKLIEFAGEFDEPQEMAVLQLSSAPNDRTVALLDLLRSVFADMGDIPIKPCGATVGSIIGPTGVGVMIYEGVK